MKTLRKTKDDWMQEIGRLRQQIEVWEVKDKTVRQNLTQILRYYPLESYRTPSSPMTWLDIAFAMGELRADANYSMLIEGRELMRQEIETLKKQLAETKGTSHN